jgi:hypothetical protein
MSHRSTAAVYDHSRSKGSARLVLLAMADEANDQGLLTAYRRSRSWLARKANVDAGTVRRAIRELVDLGELEVLATGDGRDSSDYRLTLPGLGEGGRDAPPGEASRAPRGGEMHPQGGPDAPPIIPFSPGDPGPTPPSSPSGDALFDADELTPPDPEPTFDDFWTVWPYKRGARAEALKAWTPALTRASASTIVAGARAYADDPNLPPKAEARFVPHAATWLRRDGWTEGPLPPRTGSSRRMTVANDRATTGRVDL